MEDQSLQYKASQKKVLRKLAIGGTILPVHQAIPFHITPRLI
jgi:hypothetical protein